MIHSRSTPLPQIYYDIVRASFMFHIIFYAYDTTLVATLNDFNNIEK